MNDTTERFLGDIVERVGRDQITELHLFPVLRQGGVESGLAVVAAAPERAGTGGEPDPPPDGPPRESPTGEPGGTDGAAQPRHVVYTARYRHVLKGRDRGRWESEVVAEGDAPLITVEQVVSGVVRRAGEALEPERISGDQVRAIVPAPAAPEPAPA